jgi:hypothetical protein
VNSARITSTGLTPHYPARTINKLIQGIDRLGFSVTVDPKITPETS